MDTSTRPYTDARKSYIHRLRKWTPLRATFMPLAASTETGNAESNSEDFLYDGEDLDDDYIDDQEKIGLPSDYTAEEIKVLGLKEQALGEMMLREGDCFALLESVREAVDAVAVFLLDKTQGGKHGQREGTRMHTQQTKLQQYACHRADIYNESYQRLKKLRSFVDHVHVKGSPAARLRAIIKTEDLGTSDLTKVRAAGDIQMRR